jgi:Leucine-rich repeat (LRR) protein
MTRGLTLCLSFFVLFAASAGCNKSDSPPGPSATATPNGQPAPVQVAPANSAADVEATLDLSPYLIRAQIRVPAGTDVARREGGVWLTRPEGFAIGIEPTDRPLSAAKAEWEPLLVRWVKDEPGLLIAELRAPDRTTFAFESRAKLGSRTYRIASPIKGDFNREQIDQMVKAAGTLAQTEALRTADEREAAAISALAKIGFAVIEGPDGRELEIDSDRVNDESDLVAAPMIAGVTRLKVSGYLRPAKGMRYLARMKSVERLDLFGTAATDSALAAFKGWTGLKVLSILSTDVTDAGLETIEGYTQLRKLSIFGIKVTDAGMRHVVGLKQLRALELNEVSVSDSGIQSLGNLSNLEEVVLSRTRVRGYGLSGIGSLTKLRRLSLSESPLVDGGLDRLRGSPVQQLDLSDTAVTNAGLRSLPELQHLQWLSLRGTKITDPGLVHLARVKELADLDLGQTAVTAAGLAHLRAKPELWVLHLTDTLVTDAGLENLSGCPGLSKLVLEQTGITDAGLDKLQLVKSLAFVYLAGTDVTAAGVARLRKLLPNASIDWPDPPAVPDPKPVSPPIAIDKLPPADPVALVHKYDGQIRKDDEDKNKPVISVSLQGKPVTDEELAHLRGWKGLQVVNLSGCEKVTDAGLAYLALLPELTELNLSGTSVKGDGLVCLKDAAGLRVLELPAVPMTIKQVAPLSGLKGLERLTVSLRHDGDAGLRFLAGFPKLKEADFRGIHLSNRRMTLIGQMAGLERLDILSQPVGDRGLAQVGKLKNLRELRLADTRVTDAGLQTVGTLTGLKVLELSGRRFTDVGFQQLRGLAELERLQVRGTGLTDRGMANLHDLNKLIELDLRDADVSDAGMIHLAELKELEWIDLSGTRVTDDALKNFKALEELRRLTIENSRVTGRGFAALKRLPRLARVQVNRSRVDDDGIAAIAQVEAIEQLEVDGTEITDAGIARLKALPNLRQLSLNRVPGLTDKAVDFLKAFPALTEVIVHESGLTPKAIADLKKKEGLTVRAD